MYETILQLAIILGRAAVFIAVIFALYKGYVFTMKWFFPKDEATERPKLRLRHRKDEEAAQALEQMAVSYEEVVILKDEIDS